MGLGSVRDLSADKNCELVFVTTHWKEPCSLSYPLCLMYHISQLVTSKFDDKSILLYSWHLLTLFASVPSAEPLQFHQLRRFLHLRLDHLDEVAIRRQDLGTPLQILEMAMVWFRPLKLRTRPNHSVKNNGIISNSVRILNISRSIILLLSQFSLRPFMLENPTASASSPPQYGMTRPKDH